MTSYTFAMLSHGQKRISRELQDIAFRTSQANTPGFKKTLTLSEPRVHKTPSTNFYVPKHVRTHIDWSQGGLRHTNNPNHLAITGAGLFTILTDQGTQVLTRAGNFHINQEGFLVTPEGFQVLGEGGPIALPPQEGPYQFNTDGSIANAQGIVGRFNIVDLPPDRLRDARQVGSYFLLPEGVEPIPATAFNLTQGAVETGNVETALEMAVLASTTKGGSLLSKLITDEVQLRRKLIELGRINPS